MLSKNRLKELARFRRAKECDEAGLFVVEGEKMADEALHSGWEIVAICATADWIGRHGDEVRRGELVEVSDAELERLSLQQCPNKVWVLMKRQTAAPLPSEDGTAGLTLALDHVQDPGNVGTIIRTADWFGIRRIVCSRDVASCFNPKVVQASMGGLFRTEMIYTDLPQWLAGCGRKICGAVLGGEDLYSASLQQDAVVVMGNESRGISPEVERYVGQRLTIPNVGGTAESLNVAIATSIICSEFVRIWKR